jgi:hypothetical protein
MSALIVDKKTVHRLGSSLIESNATKPSAYAMKLMQKMGWKEGQGLGRHEDGIAKHITLSKRDDNLGLGHDNAASAEGAKDHWWNNHFSEKLAAFTSSIGKKNKKKTKKSKDKKSRESSSSSSSSDSDDSDRETATKSSSAASGADPSLDELFKLTGGKLFGMRARMEQKGKIRRTESGNHLNIVESVTTMKETRTESTTSTITTEEKTEINVETQKEDRIEESPDSDNTEDKKKKSKKEKKEKKKSKKRKSSEMEN